jgi:hypothetical protein
MCMCMCIEFCLEKLKRKRPLERPRYSWENYIKIDLKKIWCGLDSSGSGYGQVTSSCEH